MRPRIFISGWLLLSILLSGSNTHIEEKATLQGSWTMIKYKYGTEKEFSEVPAIITYVKNLTTTHYSWASYGEDGNLIWAGGGTYEIVDGKYRENIEYFHPLGSNLSGTYVDFDYTINGNDWTISGYVKEVQLNPTSGKYESVDSSRLEEIWRRL